MKSKHAYCILAHKGWHQLQLLVDCLDDASNDIYLHIDRKSLDDYLKSGGVKCNVSKLQLVKSHTVYWSHISQVELELEVFKAVVDSGEVYSRVHLISGQDLPLRSQNAIHEYFDSFPNEEYVEFFSKELTDRCERRLKYYHVLVTKRRDSLLYEYLRKFVVGIQALCGVNRLRGKGVAFSVGANWCSLTMRAVREVVDKYPLYKRMFEYTTSADECFVQMILSAAENKFVFSKKGISRYIDWSDHKPSPKTFTMADYDRIVGSGCMFARKFDADVDDGIISRIVERVRSES